MKIATKVRLLAGFFVLTLLCGTAAAELPEFSDLARTAGSAVVNVSTVKTVEGSQRMERFFNQIPPGQENPFRDFFDQFERFFGDQQGPPRQQSSLGSGFIISSDGFVVTNNHVIEGADEIIVNLRGDKESVEAELVGRDPETDLALLKIKVDRDLPTLSFGDSQKMDIGNWVLAIGNPFGLDHTVTAGIISAKGRVIGSGPYDDFIQTDASINPGNSGGPLLNLDGEVVGINTAIVATGQGIGFAIPSNLAKDVIDQLKKYKKVKRGWLGVTIQNVDQNTAKALGLDEPGGALVSSVQPGDPADQAGIRTGDVVLAINGQPIDDAGDLTRQVGALDPGERIELTLWRDNSTKKVRMTLGERDLAQTAEGPDQEQEPRDQALGLQLRPVTEREAEALGMDTARGLLVAGVADGSLAAQNDIRPGDVVLEANGQTVDSVGEFRQVLETDARQKGVVMLLLKRRGQNFFVTIPMDEE
ncbi:MAG: DegQ family serine endoprotease [Desulfohalobiaceae bacterium]